MILSEQTPVPDTALPVAEFRDHLQLGSGFADDGFQDAVLIPQLRAALAAVESETGKALLRRVFRLSTYAWRSVAREVLPIAPVVEIQSFEIVDLDGGVEVIAPEKYRLVQDHQSPALKWLGWVLPTIPVGGRAEVTFEAGMAADWDGLAPDLKQAVLMLAAHFYEHRQGGERVAVPPAVNALLRKFRPIRLFGGGRL